MKSSPLKSSPSKVTDTLNSNADGPVLDRISVADTQKFRSINTEEEKYQHKQGNNSLANVAESSLQKEESIYTQSQITKKSKKKKHYTNVHMAKRIIVDIEGNGDCKTLEEAINKAEEGTIIKLCEGVYTCNVVITKPGLKIEPRDKDKPVYLLGNDGPVIKVDLKDKQFIVIKKLLLAHSGSNIAAKFNLAMNLQETNFQRKANVKNLAEFEIEKNMNCVVLVQRGGLIMRSCLLSLRSLPKNLKQKIPCFVSLPNSKVNIVGCEFMGSDNNLTAGCIMINSDVVMSSCKFTNFRAGAVYSVADKEDSVMIQDSEVIKCAIVGMLAMGTSAKQYLLRNKIESVDGPGIRIHKGSKAKVKGCEIIKCVTGIEVVSADPLIIMNKIRQNYENGITMIAKNELRCDGIIKFNDITKNKDNGILCAGKGNFTRIEKNGCIANNKRAGIKVVEGAQVSIVKNKIFSNFAQGILIVEKTSAYVEQNEVFTNYKANIAFGGEGSADTILLKNKIYSSRSEGVFVIESGYGWVVSNQIYDNNDGIIMFDSSPNVTDNSIHENQRTGMIISGCSFPKVQFNKIFGNSTSGIILRDDSTGLITHNKIFSNYYQFSARHMPLKEQTGLIEDNEVEGQNEFITNCAIF